MILVPGKIAVYLGSSGKTVSLYEKGKIVLYGKKNGRWYELREMQFFPDKNPGMKDLRRKVGEALLFLGDCRVFVALSVVGVPYFELERWGFSIWELQGKPAEFLNYVLEKEEASGKQEDDGGHNTKPAPVEYSPGSYRVSIKEVQEGSYGSYTSKQVLLPFLRTVRFNSLEVHCSHVPPWLEAEILKGGLDGRIAKAAGNEAVITITGKKEPPG